MKKVTKPKRKSNNPNGRPKKEVPTRPIFRRVPIWAYDHLQNVITKYLEENTAHPDKPVA